MYKAVYDYILKFADPPIEADRIFRGYPNRTALPLTNTYIVFTVSDNIERVGTNISQYPDDNSESTSSYRHYAVDIDFTSDDQDISLKWSSKFETLGRSDISTRFFEPYEVFFIRSSNIQFLPYVDDNRQYIYRYRVQIIIAIWETVTAQQDYFTAVELNLENVDVHHIPKEMVKLKIPNNPRVTIDIRGE